MAGAYQIQIEDDIWTLLEMFVTDAAEIPGRQEISGWNPAILYFPDRPGGHTIRPQAAKALVEFHKSLSKAYALLQFGHANRQLLKSDDINRHSPDDIQIRGRRTTDPPPWELRTLRSPPMRRLWRADQVRNAIWQSIPPSRRTSPIVFTSPLISSAYAGTGLGRRSSIKRKIFWNKLLGTATLANWNVTYRP